MTWKQGAWFFGAAMVLAILDLGILVATETTGGWPWLIAAPVTFIGAGLGTYAYVRWVPFPGKKSAKS